MSRTKITEEDGHQKEWMSRAKGMTIDELPEFLRELTEDYCHDYGTICHAIAAAAVAAAWAVEKTPQGGITGFQAGAIAWEFIKGWGSPSIGKSGARFQNYDNLLFPQYCYHFTTISAEVWQHIQSAASENLENSPDAHPNVIAHWKSIVAGDVPFGLSVSDRP